MEKKKSKTDVKISIFLLHNLAKKYQSSIPAAKDLVRMGFEPMRTYVHWNLSPTP